MPTSGEERRRRPRAGQAASRDLRIRYLDAGSTPHYVTGQILDFHEQGCAVESRMPLQAAAPITVLHGGFNALNGATTAARETAIPAHVAWCLAKSSGTFHLGIEFAEPVRWQDEVHAKASSPAGTSADYYEILQISPNADLETLQRVYRLLAQRYHPDNAGSGDTARFRQILEAYKVLSDPERRAAYDAGYERLRRERWRMFDQGRAVHRANTEQAKRKGILALLYTKRLHAPETPGMTIFEFENLLGMPREHLEFAFWYLKENGLLQRTDRGSYEITVRGVDEAEQNNAWLPKETPLLEPARAEDERQAPAA